MPKRPFLCVHYHRNDWNGVISMSFCHVKTSDSQIVATYRKNLEMEQTWICSQLFLFFFKVIYKAAETGTRVQLGPTPFFPPPLHLTFHLCPQTWITISFLPSE